MEELTYQIIFVEGAVGDCVAEFTRNDGDTFRLDINNLRVRIANLEKAGLDASIEREALGQLHYAIGDMETTR